MVAGRVRYPDAVVTCAPVPRGTDVVPEPVAVFEVLSPSTARTDRVAKNDEYRATPSIRQYVLLEQDEAAATVFSRRDEAWLGELVRGRDATLILSALDLVVPLAALYADVLPIDGDRVTPG